ncbi:MAG: AAA family ATPase [Candidatus Omnitrophica bacterium]|nr:AAA family ATPase [Candidatus Omnitrophota bacterium]
MIAGISLCFNHKRMISHRKRFVLSRGFNAIVGPNGSGKSTLLRAIYKCRDCKRHESGPTRYQYFNGEMMNPHRAYKYFKGLQGTIIRTRALFSSHGETMRDVLGSYNPQKGDCFILDEPETGHDLEWIIKIRKGLDALVQEGCQVIVASHHPVFWHNAKVIELKRDYLRQALKIMSAQIEDKGGHS